MIREPLSDIVDRQQSLLTGKTFCHFSMYVATLGIIHSFVGGVGIALMRLIFIKYPTKVFFGEMATALIITVTTLCVTAAMSGLWLVSPNKSMKY